MKNQYHDKDIPFDDLDEVSLPTALATMSSAAMNVLYRSKMETLVDVPTEDEVLFERFRKLDAPID